MQIDPLSIPEPIRITLLGISRWAEKGGSYRTIQRFFNQQIPWQEVLWRFFQQHLYQPGGTYIMAGVSAAAYRRVVRYEY